MAQSPPAQVSEETTSGQLQLAREQGEALRRAFEAMTHSAHDASEQRAGEYLLGYAVEKAEGLYHLRGGQLVWEEPREENVHIEITVRDAADGRFVPGLTVTVTLADGSGRVIGTHQQPFLWHPWLYHYGRNWQVPGDGEYTLHVRVDVPNFPRHDQKNGRRYIQPAEVTFTGVKIRTGRK